MSARVAFWGTILIAIGQAFYYTPKLPERVASHFGARGVADGWQTPSSFLTFNLLLIGLMALTFGAMPLLIRRLPATLINVPHRDYWLAPERREETRRRLGDGLFWLGALTMVFLIGVLQLVIAANLGPPPPVLGGSFWPLLGGYLVIVTAASVAYVRQFSRPGSRD